MNSIIMKVISCEDFIFIEFPDVRIRELNDIFNKKMDGVMKKKYFIGQNVIE